MHFNGILDYLILLSTRGELEIDEPGWAHNALVYTNASISSYLSP